MSDRRIIELPLAESTAKQGKIAIYDPIEDKTVQIGVQESLGAERANADWQADTTYSQDDIVIFQGLTVWKSLQNNNTGNVPSETTWWTQLTISPADGITDTQWSAGVFTYDDSKIIYNDTAYYLQTAAPFESSDIVAEIANGDWATSAGLTNPSSIFIPTGGNFTAIDIGKNLIIEFEDNGGSYALPTIVSLTETNYIIHLKNVSGGGISITSTDGIEGDNLINLIDDENLTIYVSTSEFKVL